MPLFGSPERVIDQAVAALETVNIDVFAVSSTIRSLPLGPSRRRYANAVAIVSTALEPPDLLDALHAIEAHFGRSRRGQRWQARTLDLDILLWSGGMWVGTAPELAIPHPAFCQRNFALAPACEIAAEWREPLSNLSIRQLFHRLNRSKPLDRSTGRH